MYLARGLLNLRSRDVARDIGSPVELHRTVLRAFDSNLPASARKHVGLLYRLDTAPDGGALLVMQSESAPDFARLPPSYFVDATDSRLFDLGWPTNPRVDELAPAVFASGQRCAFRLRANVTRKVETKTGDDGKKRNGKRVPVRGDDARAAWLARKAAANGFRVVDLRIREERAESGAHHGARATFAAVRYDGVLEVVDARAFEAAMRHGIGPAKAFGFGLLSVRAV